MSDQTPEWRIGRRVTAAKATIDDEGNLIFEDTPGEIIYYHNGDRTFTVAWTEGQTTYPFDDWNIKIKPMK